MLSAAELRLRRAFAIVPQMGRNILIIDDDAKLGELLEEFLGKHGFAAESVLDSDRGLAMIAQGKHDAIVLDVMLPGMDGFEVCRKVREFSAVPIIMLTARGDVVDKVVGLEMGADDYLSKPFEPRELVARLQALLRRGQRSSAEALGSPLQFDGFRIDRSARLATLISADGKERQAGLTSAEFGVLEALILRRPAVVGRGELIEQLRGIEHEAYDRSIDILISRVRAKLGDAPAESKVIKTFRGTGYAFIAKEKPPWK